MHMKEKNIVKTRRLSATAVFADSWFTTSSEIEFYKWGNFIIIVLKTYLMI